MTETGARRILFGSVALGILIILAALFGAIKPVRAQEVPVPPFMCTTSEQMQKLVKIRNRLSDIKDHEAAWSTAVNEVNAADGPIRCWKGYPVRLYPGSATMAVLIGSTVFDISQADVIGLEVNGTWWPGHFVTYVLVPRPQFGV